MDARLLGVADAPEDPAEDAVGPAGGACLAEPLGQAQGLLGRVDGEHVVARLQVEPGGLLVEAHELQARRAVLEQVDAALVVLDRRLALALHRQRRAQLAVQVRDAVQVLLPAMVVQALAPDLDRGVDPTEPQLHVALLLTDPRGGGVIAIAQQLERVAEVRDGLAVGVQQRGGVARLLEEAHGAGA